MENRVPVERWRLSLLGEIRLESRIQEGAAAVLRQPKRVAVLAYLGSASSAAVPRDEIMDLFWPRSDAHRARASLRQALCFLRRALGSQVIVQRGKDQVGLNPEWILCDVQHFWTAVNRGDHERALEHYRGDFATDLLVEGSNGFQDWVDARRLAFRKQASASAWALADEYEAAGELREAGFWGRRALALQPFDEPGVQRLIRLLERTGDRSGALRAYRGLEQWLAREFDAAPSKLTVKLIQGMQGPGPMPEGRTQDLTAAGRRSDGDRRTGQERRSWVAGRAPEVERRTGDERRSHVNRRSSTDRRRN